METVLTKEDIGSGIYTGKQTKRIRKTYNIKGNYCDDIAKGIFCQPCSLIRNDLEIRRREKVDNNIELAAGLHPPLPFGEENYRQMYAMPVTEGYRTEPYMTAANIPIQQGREMHFHPGAEGSGGQGARPVPLYPTEQEIRDHERSWRGLDPLPEIPQVASPLEGIERRAQLLTPISEQDSLDDPRLQQLRENNPQFPQVRHWLRSMSPLDGDKPIVEKTILVAGPGNPPSVVSPHGKPCPEACPKPDKKLKRSQKPEHKTSTKLSSKKKLQTAGTPKRTPDILAEPSVGATRPRAASAGAGGPVSGPVEIKRILEHNLSTDIRVASPSESQRQHSLQADMFVASPLESQHQHSLQDDTVVSDASGPQRQHSLQADPRVTTSDPSPMPEHDLTADEVVEGLASTGREHSLGADRRISVGETPVRQHSLDSDTVISLEEEPESSSSPEPEQGHDLGEDPQVTVSLANIQSHDLESDTRVPTPKLLQPQEHSISRDIRVPTPTSRRPRSHGILLDERVPTPELVRLNMEHDILQDSRVLAPNPANKEHDLQADERVESLGPSRPKQHSIRGDARVPESGDQIREHGIQSDDVVASSSSSSQGRIKDHSLSADKKVSQRAYQLLESFLEQDKRSGSKGSK